MSGEDQASTVSHVREAGAAIGPPARLVAVYPDGLSWSLSGFLAVVIGGTGSTLAPLVGGMLLGAVEVFVPYYLGGQSHVYGLLVVALVFFAFRPQGIFVRTVRA